MAQVEWVGPDTWYAPAERAPLHEVLELHRAFGEHRMAAAMLDAVRDLALVVNRQRQIVAVNSETAAVFGDSGAALALGLRPGELLGCVHAGEAPGGCGCSPACRVCGAVNTILECFESGGTSSGECLLQTDFGHDGGALDMHIRAVPVHLAGADLAVVSLRDISGQKRRAVLERAFCHDLMNLVSGLQGIAELLDDDQEEPAVQAEFRGELRTVAEQLAEEIAAQRDLLAAERGDLQPVTGNVAVAGLLAEVAETYRHHPVTGRRTIVVQPVEVATIETDRALLRRVLGNLVKNALEATPEGGEVRLGADRRGCGARLWVRNPGVIPEEVRACIFSRSFSTKGSGRGIGTHSVRLLTERYLAGQVGFESAAPEGTTFWVRLPAPKPEGNRPAGA